MRYAEGEEKNTCERFIALSADIAKKSHCLRSGCGSVIVKKNEIIGTGFNSLPLDEKPALCMKDQLPKDFKSDKTCCIHAEQRAIMEALAKHADKIKGSRIYFVRVDEQHHPIPAGKPYCTICSKLALDTGIAEFVLWHKEGYAIYPTNEYNQLSFAYRE